MSGNHVHLRSVRAIEFDRLDLPHRGITDIRIDRHVGRRFRRSGLRRASWLMRLLLSFDFTGLEVDILEVVRPEFLLA